MKRILTLLHSSISSKTTLINASVLERMSFYTKK